MKYYKAGKKIRDISELETGPLYAVCGVVGQIKKIHEENGVTYTIKSPSERIMMAIGRDELMDRIHLGMVYLIKSEIHPREKTMLKMYSPIKK